MAKLVERPAALPAEERVGRLEREQQRTRPKRVALFDEAHAIVEQWDENADAFRWPLPGSGRGGDLTTPENPSAELRGQLFAFKAQGPAMDALAKRAREVMSNGGQNLLHLADLDFRTIYPRLAEVIEANAAYYAASLAKALRWCVPSDYARARQQAVDTLELVEGRTLHGSIDELVARNDLPPGGTCRRLTELLGDCRHIVGADQTASWDELETLGRGFL